MGRRHAYKTKSQPSTFSVAHDDCVCVWSATVFRAKGNNMNNIFLSSRNVWGYIKPLAGQD